MGLIVTMFACFIVGLILVWIDPIIGSFVAFTIVTACVIRGLFLLFDIRRMLMELTGGKNDPVEEAYKKYLEERKLEK